mgnify:CR=1 FL=1
MKIISASWLITCDKNSTIIKNGAVVYDKKIIDLGTLEFIQKKYLGKDSQSSFLQFKTSSYQIPMVSILLFFLLFI